MDIELTPAEESCRQAIENYDKETDWHCEDVARRVYDLAMQCCFTKTEAIQLYRAARIHDIGKIVIPKAIIQKAGMTTSFEKTLVNLHTDNVVPYLMSECPNLDVAVALNHHQIAPSDLVSIVKTADIYSALTMVRPYKNPMDPKKALGQMEQMPTDRYFLNKYKDLLIRNKEIEKKIPSSVMRSKEFFEIRAAKYLAVKYNIDPDKFLFVDNKIVVDNNLFATLRDNGTICKEFEEIRIVSDDVKNRVFDQSINWDTYPAMVKQLEIKRITTNDIVVPEMSQEEKDFQNELENGLVVESRYDNLKDRTDEVDLVIDEYEPYDIYGEDR